MAAARKSENIHGVFYSHEHFLFPFRVLVHLYAIFRNGRLKKKSIYLRTLLLMTHEYVSFQIIVTYWGKARDSSNSNILSPKIPTF